MVCRSSRAHAKPRSTRQEKAGPRAGPKLVQPSGGGNPDMTPGSPFPRVARQDAREENPTTRVPCRKLTYSGMNDSQSLGIPAMHVTHQAKFPKLGRKPSQPPTLSFTRPVVSSAPLPTVPMQTPISVLSVAILVARLSFSQYTLSPTARANREGAEPKVLARFRKRFSAQFW